MKADVSVQERLKEAAKLWRVAVPPYVRTTHPSHNPLLWNLNQPRFEVLRSFQVWKSEA